MKIRIKPLTTLYILVLTCLLSCSEEEFLPLNPDLVTKIKFYDLDNQGNAGDLRVDFEVSNNLNVEEYRIMLIPELSISTFDESAASITPVSNYSAILPEAFKVEYSLKRLPSTLLDVKGSLVQNDIDYRLAIYIVGKSENQLSEFSESFFIRNKGIYDGLYEVFMHDKIQTDLGCNRERNMHLGTFIQQLNGVYSGGIGCIDGEEGCSFITFTRGEIFLEVSGQTISFVYERRAGCYLYQEQPEDPCYSCISSDPCLATFSGTGSIEDDLTFNIEYSGDDCGGFHEVSFTMIRRLEDIMPLQDQ